MEKISKWLDFIPLYIIKKIEREIISDILGTRSWHNYNNSYEAEYSLIKDLLGNEFMNQHIFQYPNRLGYKIEFENKIPKWRNFETNENINISEIYKKLDLFSSVKNFLQAYGKTGLTFAFTDHGAEIKIEFENSFFKKAINDKNLEIITDSDLAIVENDIKYQKSEESNIFKNPFDKNKYFLWGSGILFLIIVLGIIILIILKKRKEKR